MIAAFIAAGLMGFYIGQNQDLSDYIKGLGDGSSNSSVKQGVHTETASGRSNCTRSFKQPTHSYRVIFYESVEGTFLGQTVQQNPLQSKE